jgi:ligand-binding sensor domain-containing protein/signal transduction histidine kinase
MFRLNRILPVAAILRGVASTQSAWRAWFLAMVTVLAAWPVRGDDFGAELRDFAVRTWSKADGLPDGSVTVVQQTLDGYLWVGTAAGLVRFDGVKFTEVPLPKRGFNRPVAITALCEDMLGCLWIGTEDRGLFCWKDGRLQHFGTAEGLLDENVTSLTLDAAGHLWIGTKRGVNRRDGNGFVAFTSQDGLPDNSVSSVHAARSGTVWITTAGGMCRFVDGRISRFVFPTTGQERQEEFLGAYEDRQGNLWAFCATYLINLAEGKAEGKRINYFPGEKSAMTRIWSLCEGRGGRLWIGASGRGVFGFDGTKFQPVTLNEGHWPNDVRTICEDHEGNLWLGISDGVLAQLRPQRFALLAGDHGLPAGGATCLMGDSLGRVYVGMDSGGLYANIGDRFEKVIDATKWLGQELVASVCAQPDGSLWVGTTGSGLYHLKDGQSVVYSTANGLSDDCVLAVCADAQGTVWAGTRAGALHQFKEGKVSIFTSADGLPGSPITALMPASAGGLWVGTESGALLHSDAQFQNVAAAQLAPALSGKAILGLCEGPGQSIWIGSAGGGLGCLTENRCLVWNNLDGLLDDVVSGVVEDTEASLWLVMPRGLCRIASNSVASALAGRGALKPKLMFETEPGLDRALNLGWPRAVRSPEGRLWFATVGGLVGIDTRAWEGEKPAPQVHLEAVYINNELTPLAALEHGRASAVPTTPVKFPTGLHSLEFQATGLSFEAPERIRFRHKLDGFDADWVETGPERRVRYGRLPSGTYTFHVTACNAEGVWNERGASLAFVILTPLWRAPWMLALYGLGAAMAAAGTVRLVSHRRLRRRLAGLEHQQAMERERMRIARNMHDEIGSKLTKISFLSERLKVESKPTGPAGVQVDSIATTSRDLLKALDEMVWVVNPHNDTLENLASYLSQYAREYFQETPVECDLRVQSELPPLNMSAEYRHNVFLAFEESLSNVLKHARASRVEVQIQIEMGFLRIRISDNGVGFAPEARHGKVAAGGRNGLANMRQHLADVGGSCVIQSQPGRGASVELKVALASATVEDA